MQVTTTLASYQSKSGNKNGRAWTLHIFTDAGGQDYTTLSPDHYGALVGKVGNGQPVTLIYQATVDQYGEKRRIEHVVPEGAPQQVIPAAPNFPTVQHASNPIGQAGDQKEQRIMWGNAGNMAANLLAPLGTNPENHVGLTALHRLQWDIYQHLLKGPRPVEENIQWSDPQPSDGIPY